MDLNCWSWRRFRRWRVESSFGPRSDTAPPLPVGAIWNDRWWMNPSRKRRIRLVTALTAALLAAGALVWTSFSAGSDERTAGQLIDSAVAGQTYTLAGTVASGSVRREDGVLWFSIRDPRRPVAARVRYTGLVPDPFRE